MARIITIIPAYNEENTVARVVKEAKPYSDQVIVIDDGSLDATAKNSAAAGAIVISNKKNLGLGASVRRGYEMALKRRADIVVQVDADGQYATSDIPKLIRPISDNKADMVIASRFLGGIEEMPLIKKIGNHVFTFLTSIVTGRRLSDAQSGFRAIRRELVKKILPTEKHGYTHETIIAAARNRARILEVPSYFKRRKYGGSRLISSKLKYAIREGKVILRGVFR